MVLWLLSVGFLFAFTNVMHEMRCPARPILRQAYFPVVQHLRLGGIVLTAVDIHLQMHSRTVSILKIDTVISLSLREKGLTRSNAASLVDAGVFRLRESTYFLPESET